MEQLQESLRSLLTDRIKIGTLANLNIDEFSECETISDKDYHAKRYKIGLINIIIISSDVSAKFMEKINTKSIYLYIINVTDCKNITKKLDASLSSKIFYIDELNTVPTKNIFNHTYKILSKNDIKHVISNYDSINNLPRILHNDIIRRWLDIPIGSVVEITSKVCKSYRIVENS